ncbi:MAG TPA: ATP-dependent sacrificial sulfur transferase LarE [Mobilitalea sp.]|nr:ATP-dependent sacrificial sulfur transferase LarE [Mobilitalea sp.]
MANITLQDNKNNLEQLTKYLEEHIGEGIGIAFSGGVDSSLLLRIACDVGKKHNKQVLAITFETKLHPHGDLDEAKALALSFGAVHKTIEVDEFADPEIMHNPVDRCYRCKNLLFRTLIKTANEEGYHFLIDGSNFDDLKAYRPGMKALKELGIHSPLLELQVTKAQIRSLAAELGIASSDKPSAPCLATRLPYGATLDFDLLAKIDQGEKIIRQFGFYNVRLRAHGDIIRIEIDKKDFAKFLEHQEEILKKLKELDFVYITLDLEGFRSGSMDVKIEKNEFMRS